MSPLHYVDWETICVYTCSNYLNCLPNFSKQEFIVEEACYVQLSTDFDRVQYGTAEQVAKLRN
jgi:hypothetical protein